MGKWPGSSTSNYRGRLYLRIPEETPVKCLRKWYDGTLTNRSNVSRTEKQADKWLRKIQRSGLPGTFKISMVSYQDSKIKTRSSEHWHSTKNLLQVAQSWEIRMDLGRKLHFPQVIQTSLKPHMVWGGEEIILTELTVPWEDGCEEASERKAIKDQDLVQQCRVKEWQALLFPVEVVCRGFPAQPVWKTLGIAGKERKTADRRLV